MDNRDIDLHGMFNIVRRRLKLIFFILFVGMLLTSSVVFLLPPSYAAKTQLLLDVAGSSVLNSAQSNAFGLTNSIVESEAKLIKSEPVLRKTFADLGLSKSKEYGPGRSWLNVLGIANAPLDDQQGEAVASQTIEEFGKHVSAKRVGLTFLIEVVAHSENAKHAADIANGIANSHIELKLQNSLSQTLAAQTLLENNVSDNRALLEAANARMQSFFDDNLEEIARQTSDIELEEIRGSITQIRKSRGQSEELIKVLYEFQDSQNWPDLGLGIIGPSFEAALQQRSALRTRIENTSDTNAKFALSEQLELLDKQVKLLVDQELSVLEADLRKGIVLERDLLSTARDRAFEIDLPSPILGQFYQVKANADAARRQYEDALASAMANRARASTLISDVRIVSAATPPLYPSSPNKPLTLILALLFFSCGATVLALVLDQYWGGITSTEQLERLLGMRVSAILPKFSSAESSDAGLEKNLAFVMDTAPHSTFAEAIRKVRSELELELVANSSRARIGAKDGKVILISSPVEREGKSTVSIALAKSMALSGARTIIVDADLRKPTIHNYLGLEGENGLVEFLKDQKQTDLLSNSFKANVAPKLDVLPGRNMIGLETDALVSSVGFQRLISSLKKHYDFVVLDTPPLLPVVDTSYLLPLADVFVLVVGFQKTDQGKIKHAAKLLSKHAHLDTAIIPVLNKSDQIAAHHLAHYGGYSFCNIAKIAAD